MSRIERGGRVPGVVQVSARLPVAQAIEEVLLIMECCKPEDWEAWCGISPCERRGRESHFFNPAVQLSSRAYNE